MSESIPIQRKNSKSSYAYEDLIACGQGELFAGGLPRLPSPPFLMFDRFTLLSDQGGKYNKGQMIGELDINPELWFFKCHFLTDPVMPGCLGLDALWQMLGFYLGWSGGSGRGRALGAGEIKFSNQVLPKNKLVTYRMDIKRLIKRKLYMGIADGIVEVDGEKIYECNDLRVGLME